MSRKMRECEDFEEPGRAGDGAQRGSGKKGECEEVDCGDSPSSAGLRGHGKNLGLHPRGSEKL